MGHTLKTFLLFIAAFIEGFILLFLEISTPVAVAPVFGQNLHVWSSMLGITLLSLMLGYFAADEWYFRDFATHTPIVFLPNGANQSSL